MKLQPPAFGPTPTLDEATATVVSAFGGAVIDLPPDHWVGTPDDGKLHIYIEGGGGKRPDWSRRQAAVLAHSQIATREWLEWLNKMAKELGHGRVASMPKQHRVVVCPRCNELQMSSSSGNRSCDECTTCPLSCSSQAKHRGNQLNCPDCKSEMQIVWTSDTEIPKEWL